MKKVNYFDFGVFRGREINIMIKHIFPYLKIDNYQIFGFEASPKRIDKLISRYRNVKNVKIINAAISDHNGIGNLYHSFKRKKYIGIGDSLFKSKWNVKEDVFEKVICILFSEWLIKNVPSYKNDFNIIRSNIEGAEWFLFNDLKNNDIIKYISIFCGADPYEEVNKVKEIRDKIPELKKIIINNNINFLQFMDKPDINGIISELEKKYHE